MSSQCEETSATTTTRVKHRFAAIVALAFALAAALPGVAAAAIPPGPC
ncbi:MAG: hypothetical protein QOK40_651 [Miltoncostaeaceae bacterium]|jgi:hypothetical protein|nr:hypothetical protein [Miltoncostaeaceae bacterium]